MTQNTLICFNNLEVILPDFDASKLDRYQQITKIGIRTYSTLAEEKIGVSERTV